MSNLSGKRIVMLIAIIAACSLAFSSSAWSETTYKIGGLFSITGPSSFLGDPEKKSMEMAIEAINKAGGIDGNQLEAIIYDDEGDPTKANLGASKLISKDNVIAIIGPSLTPTTLAVIPLVEKAQMLLISCAAGNAITDPVKPLVFKTAQSDVLAVSSIYAYLQKQNIQKIGILTVSTAFGESGKQQLENQSPAFGIKIVQAENFGDKDTDMTAQLTKIKSKEPQAIVCWGTNPGPAVVAKNMQQLGFKIPLYQSHGVASPKFIELAKEAAEGIYLPAGKILIANLLPDTDPQKSVLLTYLSEYKAKYNSSVSAFGGYAYDAVYLLAKAMKGSNGDKEKIRKNLEEIKNHVGISGAFNFNDKDHNGLNMNAFVMVQIKNGTWELIK